MLRPQSPLLQLSPYVYGTTRLGDDRIPFEERVAIARKAIDSGVWIHTSDQYGEALSVLNAAFEVDRTQIPNQFFKVGHESVAQVRESILRQLGVVGLSKMTVAQLCLGGGLAEDFKSGKPGFLDLLQLREEGLADGFVVEIFPWISETPYQALKAGHADKLVDAFIFYLNPLQRFVTNELWDLIVEREFPVVAMRTVCGGDIYDLCERDTYHAGRAKEVLPLFQASQCKSWNEFCVRFLAGFPFVLTTVGSTSRARNLDEFLALTAGEVTPLPDDIQQAILKLQRKWSDEVDRLAEPWTM